MQVFNQQASSQAVKQSSSQAVKQSAVRHGWSPAFANVLHRQASAYVESILFPNFGGLAEADNEAVGGSAEALA